MEVSRRTFIKTVGTSALGMAFPAIFRKSARTYVPSSDDLFDEEKYFFCGVCDNICGMIARYKDGRIREIVGNPADELGSMGSICVKGESSINTLYDPNRLKHPMKRTNPKKGVNEDPGWVKISWEEAFQTIGKKFREAIDKHGPQTVLCIMRPKTKEKAFFQAIGTPNQVCHVDTCYITYDVAWKVSWGAGKSWTMDLENAKYILAFGWDQPAKSKMYQLKGFMAAKDKGAKVVVFDPRFSVTASKADEWISIKPGTDLAVALAMIYVIIEEDLYDKEYVSEMTVGFDNLAKHVRSKGYTPEWAEKISGVKASKIREVAKEFATTKPSILAMHKRDAGGPNYANSFPLAQAMFILNALVGAIERPGGHYMSRQPKVTPADQFRKNMAVPYPEPPTKVRVDGHDKYPIAVKIAKGFSKGNFSHLADGIMNPPYPVTVGIAHSYNVLSFPNPKTIIEALTRLEFFVAVDILPSEICQIADIVLPDLFFLEENALEAREYHSLWEQVLIRDGKPLYDNKGFGEIVNELLKSMGLGDYVIDWKAKRQKTLEELGTTWEEIIKNKGVWQNKSGLLPDGHPKPKKEFETPSKKLELDSSLLAQNGYESLPTWHEPYTEPDDRYPYYFLTNHLPWFRMNKGVNDSALMELQPENLAYIHPETAKKLGVGNDDYIIIESQNGMSIKVKVSVTDGIRPDCVMTEHGYGHWSKEMEVAYGRGTCDGDVMLERKIKESLKIKAYDPTQSSCLLDFKVNLKKA